MDESNLRKLTVGLVLLLTGVLLFFQFDHSTDAGFSMLWPLYLVLFGLMGLFKRCGRGFSGLLLLIGVFFLLRSVNVFPHIPSMYVWPSIIILVAFVTIFSAFRGRKHAVSTAGGIRYSAFFGETKETVKEQDFKGLSIWTMFGGVEVDLTKADIQDESAVVDIFVMFGGADIIIPENWVAEVRITPIFGGVENKAKADNREKRLLLTGSVLFGGASVWTR